jgi:uncharacterized membrane protein
MSKLTQFVRTTILGGVVFLIPFVVLIIILAKALAYAKQVVHPLVGLVPAASRFHSTALIAVVLVTFLCFLAGLIARTAKAQKLVKGLESSVLCKLPAYDYLKQQSTSALGFATMAEQPVVLVETDFGWQIGVETAKASGGFATVFMPGAPNPHSGAVYFVPTCRIRTANIELFAALNCMRRCGAGAPALLKDFSILPSAQP